MRILNDDRVPPDVATAVSVGAYDGIHLGHRKVLTSMVDLARSQDLRRASLPLTNTPRLSFDPRTRRCC